MTPMEAVERVPLRKKCPPRALTIANEIRAKVRALEKQIADAKRKAKRKHDAGVILLDYLKSLGENKTVNTAAMRRIRGAAAEFINP